MKDFTKLRVWEKSHSLTLDIYHVSRSFPREERFGITTQIRRSAASVPTNLAEGSGRRTDADFARYVDMASGSINETIYHLILAHDLDFIETTTFNRLSTQAREIRKMLTSLSQKLRAER